MPFQHNFFATGFALDRKRTRIDLRLDWSQEDHQDSDLDRDLLRAGFSLAREFSRKVFGLVAIDFIQRDYEDRNRKDDDWRGLVSLGYRFEPAFSISLHYSYYRRDSNEDTADFDEKRAFLRVVYTPAWGR